MLDRGEGRTRACCSSKQIKSLDMSLSLSKAVLNRCPSCADNFAHLHCINTCSPNQTLTVKVTRTMNVTALNKTKEVVVGYQAFLSSAFAEGAFDSCKNVRIPATGGYAISTMCGRYGHKLCTAQRWYDFQGDSSNGLAPLDIDFSLVKEGETEGIPDGVVPYDGESFRCNETTPTGGIACSCQDCQSSCPSVPPPPPPVAPFRLLGTDGFLVISVILLCLLLLTFLLYLAVSYWVSSRRKHDQERGQRKKNGKNSNDVSELVVHPSQVTCAEKNSLAAQALLSSGFRNWGTVMATYPLTVSTLAVKYGLNVGVSEVMKRRHGEP